jgi:hypothetical protein
VDERDAVRCPPDLAARIADCTAAALPPLFPDANVVDRRTRMPPAPWTRSIRRSGKAGASCCRPAGWACPARPAASARRTAAGTCAPPSLGFPPFLNINTTQDVVVSLTRVMGRHTAKAGFYLNHSVKSQNLNSALDFQGAINFGNDTRNPLDTGFPFANAAVGVFSSYGQQSRFIEGQFVYNNVEAYLQDSWRGRSADDRLRRAFHCIRRRSPIAGQTTFFPDRGSVTLRSSTSRPVQVPHRAAVRQAGADKCLRAAQPRHRQPGQQAECRAHRRSRPTASSAREGIADAASACARYRPRISAAMTCAAARPWSCAPPPACSSIGRTATPCSTR